MGVIVDTGVKNYIDQLEAKGSFSLANAFRKANEISVAALASMAFIPPEYQALVENSVAFQVIKNHQEEKSKHTEEEKKKHDFAEWQEKINRTVMHLQIDGQNFDIDQDTVRKVLHHRLDELEEQRRELLRNGGNADELNRLNKLIDDYEPVVNDVDSNPVDANRGKEVQRLIHEDPDLSADFKDTVSRSLDSRKSVEASEHASFSSQLDANAGIQASALTAIFSAKADPSVGNIPQPSRPASPQDQKLNNTLQSLGF